MNEKSCKVYLICLSSLAVISLILFSISSVNETLITQITVSFGFVAAIGAISSAAILAAKWPKRELFAGIQNSRIVLPAFSTFMAGVSIFFNLQASRLTGASLRIDSIAQKSAISEKIANEELSRVQNLLGERDRTLNEQIVVVKEVIDAMSHPVVTATTSGSQDSYYPSIRKGRRLLLELLRGNYDPQFSHYSEEALFRETVIRELGRMGPIRQMSETACLWHWESPVGVDVNAEFPLLRERNANSKFDLQHLQPDEWNFAKLSNFSTESGQSEGFTFSVIENAEFLRADCSDLDIYDSSIPSPKFSDTILKKAAFVDSELPFSQFSGNADCREVLFENCNLVDLQISGGDWTDATFLGNRMWNSSFGDGTGKIVWDIDFDFFRNNDVRNGYSLVNFEILHSLLESNDLRGFTFDNGFFAEGHNFGNNSAEENEDSEFSIDLTGVACEKNFRLVETAFQETRFLGARLGGEVVDSNFIACDFSGADLNKITFKNTNISGSHFGRRLKYSIPITVIGSEKRNGEEIPQFVIGQAPALSARNSSRIVGEKYPTHFVEIDVPGAVFPKSVDNVSVIGEFTDLAFGGEPEIFGKKGPQWDPFEDPDWGRLKGLNWESSLVAKEVEIDPKFLFGQFSGTWMTREVRDVLLARVEKAIPNVEGDLRKVLENAKSDLTEITEVTTLIPESEGAENWNAWGDRKKWTLRSAILSDLAKRWASAEVE